MLQQTQVTCGTLRAKAQSSSLNITVHLRVERRLLRNTSGKCQASFYINHLLAKL